MAIPTVQITGSVVTPGGVGVTSGTIELTLSHAGTVPDGSARIPGGKYSGPAQKITLGASGVVPAGTNVIPNDAIQPAGTVWSARYSCVVPGETAPVVWIERWNLASLPNPVAIGAIEQVETVGGQAAGFDYSVVALAKSTDARLTVEVSNRTAADVAEAAARSAEDAGIRAQVACASLGGGVNIADTSTVLAASSTTSRTLAAHLGDEIRVVNFGAKCDGTTNDSVAVQAAADLAEARGGGYIVFPAGTCICNFKVGSKVGVRGQGVRTTILKAAPGTNAAVIEGKHFAALNGTDNPLRVKQTGDINAGDNYVQIENLTLDGNKATQASGWVLRLWGRSYIWHDLIVQNGKSGGIWTEFTTHDGGTPEDLLESYYYTLKVTANDGDGWRYRGPHDSWLVDAIFVGNAGWAIRVEQALGTGGAIRWNGGLNGRGWNSWLNANSYYASGPIMLTHSIASGESGVGIELAAGSGSCFFDGMTIGGHATGIIVRGTNHRISGIFGGGAGVVGAPGVMANAIVLDGAGYTTIDATTFGVKNQVDGTLNNEVGANLIRVAAQVPVGGTLKTGTFGGLDFVDIVPGGALTAPFVQRPPSMTNQYFNAGVTIWQADGYGLLVKAKDSGTVMARYENAGNTKAAQITGDSDISLSGGAKFTISPVKTVTGSRANPEQALVSLITKLVELGLIADSTTP